VTAHDLLCNPHCECEEYVRCDCALIARVSAAVAEEIAQAIEAGCVHGKLVGSRAVCYRCKSAAAIARTFKGVSE